MGFRKLQLQPFLNPTAGMVCIFQVYKGNNEGYTWGVTMAQQGIETKNEVSNGLSEETADINEIS